MVLCPHSCKYAHIHKQTFAVFVLFYGNVLILGFKDCVVWGKLLNLHESHGVTSQAFGVQYIGIH